MATILEQYLQNPVKPSVKRRLLQQTRKYFAIIIRLLMRIFALCFQNTRWDFLQMMN